MKQVLKSGFSIILLLSAYITTAQHVVDVGYLECIARATRIYTPSSKINQQGDILMFSFLDYTIDLDPSLDSAIVSVYDDTGFIGTQFYMAKYSEDLDLLWYHRILRKDGNRVSNGSTTVTEDGDLLVFWKGSSDDFDPNPAVTVPLYSEGFLARYDGNTGYLKWINGIKLHTNDDCLEYSENTEAVYVGTRVKPNESIVFSEYNTPKDSLTGSAYDQMAVFKSDAQGQVKWVKRTDGTYETVLRDMITTDNGDFIAVGYYIQSTDLSLDRATTYPLSFPAAGKRMGFLARYDSSGAIQWAYNVGGFQEDEVYKVTLDPQKNIYIEGYFSDEVDFDVLGTSPTLLTADYPKQQYVAKYNPQLQLQWVQKINHERGRLHVLDFTATTDGEILLSGGFDEILEFPGGPLLNEEAEWYYDGYIAVLDAQTGLAKHATRLGTDGDISLVNMFRKIGPRYKLLGQAQRLEYYDAQENFRIYDVKPRVYNYIMTMDDFPMSVEQLSESATASLYPNPTTGALHIELAEGADRPTSIAVYDVTGMQVYEGVYNSEISLDKIPSGTYFLRLMGESQSETIEFMIRR